MSAADFQDPRRGELELEQAPQPMDAPLRQVGAAPGNDVGTPQVRRLMIEPIVFAVKVF